MKTTWKSSLIVAAVLMAVGTGGCANMSPQQRDTAAGAAIGGVAGSVLTGGDSLGTIGGAVVGGYIGSKRRP